jgi:hypothetical protein
MKRLLALCCLACACTSGQAPAADRLPQGTVWLDTSTVVSTGYVGNGAQWDPYQLNYGSGPVTLSAADWDKLYQRLDYMRPQFIRVMTNTTSQVVNGALDPERNSARLTPILDYCQSRGVTVMFGDWGGGTVNAATHTVNETMLHHAAAWLQWLLARGYSCIKYYNLINEPNGDWSVTNTSYTLWRDALRCFHRELVSLGISNAVEIVGPDIAIWSAGESWWIDSCASQLPEVTLYDIHTYPSKCTVNGGEYTNIIAAYQQKVPKGKKIIMGEIGFKYVEAADRALWDENIRRAAAKPYASTDDSQMFVFDSMYGTDMADALIQTINSGYSGAIAWMLDDAMHSKEAPDKLKVWGFWNILGDELFGAEEETVRPWYYAWSLLTRYVPAGSTVYSTTVEDTDGVKVALTGKDGQYMLAIVNVASEPRTITLKSNTLRQLVGCQRFLYADGALLTEGDHTLLPVEKGLTLDLQQGLTLALRPASLQVFTTFNF